MLVDRARLLRGISVFYIAMHVACLQCPSTGKRSQGSFFRDARMAIRIVAARKVVPFNDFLTFLDEWWQTAGGADASSVKIYAHPVALVQECLSCLQHRAPVLLCSFSQS